MAERGAVYIEGKEREGAKEVHRELVLDQHVSCKTVERELKGREGLTK